MEKLSDLQNRSGQEIENLWTNFKKDSRSRKTSQYLQARREKLENLWTEFTTRDLEIQQTADYSSDHPYITKGFFKQVEEIYQAMKKALEKEDQVTATPAPAPRGNDCQRMIRAQKAAMSSFRRRIRLIEESLSTPHSKVYYEQNVHLLNSGWTSIAVTHHELMANEELSEYSEDEFFDLEGCHHACIIKLMEKCESEHPSRIDAGTQQNVKLPKITLPSFAGDYLKWKEFSDMFSQLIHQQSMSNTQKMFYLKRNITGEAAKLIQHLQVCEEHYTTAWELLQNRYNNTRLIVSAFLNNLLNQPNTTVESASAIKRLHDITQESLQGIRNSGIDVSTWDAIIVHILLQKIDPDSHRMFEQSLEKPREVQKLSTLLNFLETRFQILESMGSKKEKTPHQRPTTKKQAILLTSKRESSSCPLCKSHTHNLRKCREFLQLSPTRRMQEAKRLQLCTNCLSRNHMLKNCPSRSCFKCNQRHHTLLHANSDTPITTNGDSQTSPTATNAVHAVFDQPQEITKYIFLATAIVKILDYHQNAIECRAILDSGSQVNFISERLFKKLRLPATNRRIHISGIGDSQLKSQRRVNITLSSRISNYTVQVEAFVIPEITSLQPSHLFKIDSWPIPGNIQLADPEFHKPSRIDLLIGAEIYSELMSIGQIKLAEKLPTLQNSVFGWVVLGRMQAEQSCPNYVCGISTTTLSQQLEKFWTLEEELITTRQMTEEENRCESHFDQTTFRGTDGRFTVKLPFSQSASHLGDSKELATRRFLSLEKRLMKDKPLYKQYSDVMEEFLELQHMEPVELRDIPTPHYFMPHHCVLKPQSSTTKLRVVFDASAKTNTNVSLNDILLSGPTIQDGLLAVLLRFRLHKYVFAADIAKMYRQIWVAEEDRNYQLILWRNNPTDDLKVYRLCTVTYGTTSAPYLATKCLQRLADNEQAKYPTASKHVQRDFYVDDLMTGCNSLSEAVQLQTQIRELLKSGGFTLRKWCANHPELLQSIPSSDIEAELELGNNVETTVKTLGLTWMPRSDKFIIKTSLPEHKRLTKRTVVSDIAHLYDPLGLINPVVVLGKIFIQELWLRKLDWDAALPMELHTTWERFRQELKELDTLSIQRRAMVEEASVEIQLHAFSDASEKAYGTAIYLRSTDKNGNTAIHLLTAKSKVAPTKRTTLPRLELCAAKLMADLVHQLKACICIPIHNVVYWTDSSIVLSWIRSPSASFQTFVANRVAAIQGMTQPAQWRHISTEINPADLVSRGVPPKKLITSKLWFHGPEFLKLPEYMWPTDSINVCDDDSERKRIKSVLTISSSTSILSEINHKNSFTRLQRVVAYILRFTRNAKRGTTEGHQKSINLRADEVYDALMFIMKEVQRDAFTEDLKQMKKTGSVLPTSNLNSLTPVLDENGLIRVGGRIQASALSRDAKHPILLPYSHWVTTMLMTYIHTKHLHAGPQALLALTRQRFWPMRGKTLAHSIVHKCVKCARARPKSITQLMGNLPMERVQPSRPFTNVGIDFCGPVYVHYRIRGKVPTKAYIAVFVCFSTKACHLELVADLTTAAFIGSLKRFIARRGRPRKIFCDNATNFVGARNELQDLHKFFMAKQSQDEINHHCTEEQIQWCPIPPRSPHFGGLWEAAVKSAKHHMRRTVSAASLTYEELTTVIAEIEAILNSRPLTAMSTNANDLQALTPAHFLIGEPLTTLPNPHASQNNHKLLVRWKLVQAIQREFWQRWSSEYLQELQLRSKWKEQREQVKIGTIVLLKDDNLPPLKWPMGKITQLFKGQDGLARVVEVKTPTGIVKRAIQKICPLPVETDEEIEVTDSQITQVTTMSATVIPCQGTGKSISKSSKTNSYSTAKRIAPHHSDPRNTKRRRILPINSNWHNNPTAMQARCSTLKKFLTWSDGATVDNNSSDRKVNATQTKPANDKPKKISLNIIPVILLACLVSPVLSQQSTEAVEITPFHANPGLYFEGLGQANMVTDDWNLIVYYKLNTYWQEVTILKQGLTKIRNLCRLLMAYKEYCITTARLFQQRISSIEETNEILIRSDHNRRLKRAPLNIVGSIANKLFGVLDEEYGEQVAQTIDKINKNEDYLAELIKNQTSIIDSTLNIIKTNSDDVTHQLTLIETYVTQIRTSIKAVEETQNEERILQAFNSLTIHTMLISIRYQGIQAALIDVITDAHGGKINPLLLTPDQLRQELHIIRENLPPTLVLPGQLERPDLIQLYSLMTVRTRVTSTAVVFHLKVPLISKEQFEIFTIVPVPIHINNTINRIKPASEILAVSLHRDQYYQMSKEEMDACILTRRRIYLCRQRHAIYFKTAGTSQCELALLSYNNALPTSCAIERLETNDVWTQLTNPNCWLYAFEHEQPLHIVCEAKGFQKTLRGEGILCFKGNCVLRHEQLTISSHNFRSSQAHISLIPSIQINSTQIEGHIHKQWLNSPELQPMHIKNNTQEIVALKKEISAWNFQIPERVTLTSSHHLVINYVGFSIAVAVAFYIIIAIIKRCKKIRGRKHPVTLQQSSRENIELYSRPHLRGHTPPEPTTRRSKFQLQTTKVGAT